MKYINTISAINKLLMIFTIVLYLTVFLGLIFQIVLGVYQLIIALILLFNWANFSKVAKKNLLIYWGAVLLFGICHMFEVFHLNHDLWFISYAIIPMSIAFCFSIFLEKLKQIG